MMVIGGIMKITVRRGMSRSTYGYFTKWDIYADEEYLGSFRDNQTITYEVNNANTIRI